MKLILIFLILSPLYAQTFQDELSLYCSSSVGVDFEFLENAALEGDVEDMLENAVNHIKNSKKCSQELFHSRSKFSLYIHQMIRNGWKVEIEKNRKIIKNSYKQRDISPFWERLKLFAEKMDQTPYFYIKEKTIEKYLEKGKAAAVIQKANCTSSTNGIELGSARDQDSIGWCYAHTAADLLSQAYGKLFSAVGVAHSYNQSRQNIVLTEGGDVEEAVYASLRKGVCLESELPSSDYQFSMMSDYQDALESIQQLLQGAQNSPQAIENLCEECKGDIFKIFPEASIEALVLIAKAGGDPLAHLFDFSCKNRFRPPIWPTITSRKKGYFNLLDRRTANGLLNEIDKQLSNNKIISISYDSNFLYDRDYEGKHIGRANHASSVIGRRYNEEKGRCDYLIRNSWGTDCNGYDSDYLCEEGNIWVDGFDLRETIDEIHYLN